MSEKPLKNRGNFWQLLDVIDSLDQKELLELMGWCIEVVCCPPCGIDRMTSRELWTQQQRGHQALQEILKTINKQAVL